MLPLHRLHVRWDLPAVQRLGRLLLTSVNYLSIGCACLTVAVFALSALSKVRSRKAFGEFLAATRTLLATSVRASQVSGTAARTAGMMVVAAEVAITVLVALPSTARAGFGVAALLLLCFSVAIVATLRRGVRTECRCFGPSSAPLSRRHLVRNGVLLAVALGGLITAEGRGERVHPAGVAIAVGAALVAAALVVRFDDLADLFVTPANERRES
ncbi:MauE/DoxX family redox-associated membrane protein [Streptosporangium sp. NPDC049644]|uniref:MauE/DoxX family redox-associated membrane protein n=1 Tax=Streptosporangium sp. NPDC049644 TaxID=3155507 RepID=UPI003420D00E